MPDPIITPALDPALDPEAVAENNRKVAAALERSADNTPEPDPVAIQSLDDLHAAKVKEKEEAAKKAAEEAPPITEETPEAKEAAEAAAKKLETEKAERDASLKKADDIFKDAPTLPTGASPKSSEAFASIKIRAAQEVSRLEAELAKVREEAEKIKASTSERTPEQIAKDKELEELRTWRTKMDVDFDPKFKSFDTTVSKANDFIYSLLRKSPAVNDDTIKQIEKFGGPDRCNLTELFKAINDPVLQRTVESQISDIVKTRYEKEQAVKAAKENLTSYLADREKNIEASATSHHKATATELASFTASLDWFKEQAPTTKSTPEEKAKIEDHNKFVTQLRGEIKAALDDDSPRMRATLITGLAQLFQLQRIHESASKRLAVLEKENAEITKKWNAVKRSGQSRLAESGAVPGAKAPVTKPKDEFNVRATDALDAAAKQILEERARAGANA